MRLKWRVYVFHIHIFPLGRTYSTNRTFYHCVFSNFLQTDSHIIVFSVRVNSLKGLITWEMEVVINDALMVPVRDCTNELQLMSSFLSLLWAALNHSIILTYPARCFRFITFRAFKCILEFRLMWSSWSEADGWFYSPASDLALYSAATQMCAHQLFLILSMDGIYTWQMCSINCKTTLLSSFCF